ncbi:MAG: RNA polymerase sigma factor [Bacteroidota bacterium]
MKVTKEFIKNTVANAKKGDEKAFSFLLHTFWNDVYTYHLAAHKNENQAEEITIIAFAKAFDKIHTFDERYSFKTWLIAISKNVHIDLVRKRKNSILRASIQQEEDETLYNIADDTPTVEDQIITEQNLKSLLNCIKKLKPHYQEVINLRYFQELSYKEMADRLGEPVNNIKIKLLRAKKLLAEIIQDTHEEFS